MTPTSTVVTVKEAPVVCQNATSSREPAEPELVDGDGVAFRASELHRRGRRKLHRLPSFQSRVPRGTKSNNE
eukprot:CAMPEP_0177781690 /NCGR_PEP_ID=MMETSP0491_2-20121128/18008_1 /TAXON_ID=63592 /ORGANISM="Tetraselmis chuii, Strain PLY429" /LENGTH=71 /DNA_ID=CAMNT_0019301819 /DNA_START=7 /DNA_END=222 /DNA_ORIENTATION=+